MPTTRLFAVALVVTTSSFASAVIIRHDKDDKLYKDLAAEARFDPVGLFEYTSSSATGIGTVNYVGKGKAGKKWFVTAAHVINESMTSATVALGGKTYNVELASRIWVSGFETGKDDLGAFAILDPDNTLTMAAAKVWNTTKPVPAAVGDHWTGYAAGFGRTGTGLTGDTGASRTKRAMTNKIDALGLKYNSGGSEKFGYLSDFDKNDAANNTLDKTDFADANYDAGQVSARAWLDLEGQLAAGDSGGGLFAEFASTFAMVGIASTAGRLGNGTTSTYGAHTNWSPFTKDNVDRIERWTGITAVPEPTTLAALSLGLLALNRRRRKS